MTDTTLKFRILMVFYNNRSIPMHKRKTPTEIERIFGAKFKRGETEHAVYYNSIAVVMRSLNKNGLLAKHEAHGIGRPVYYSITDEGIKYIENLLGGGVHVNTQ